MGRWRVGRGRRKRGGRRVGGSIGGGEEGGRGFVFVLGCYLTDFAVETETVWGMVFEFGLTGGLED